MNIVSLKLCSVYRSVRNKIYTNNSVTASVHCDGLICGSHVGDCKEHGVLGCSTGYFGEGLHL
jgi:hypothetical protein